MNSICVASSGQLVFSGDSVGDVMVWCKEKSSEQCEDVGQGNYLHVLPSLLPLRYVAATAKDNPI